MGTQLMVFISCKTTLCFSPTCARLHGPLQHNTKFMNLRAKVNERKLSHFYWILHILVSALEMLNLKIHT